MSLFVRSVLPLDGLERKERRRRAKETFLPFPTDHFRPESLETERTTWNEAIRPMLLAEVREGAWSGGRRWGR